MIVPYLWHNQKYFQILALWPWLSYLTFLHLQLHPLIVDNLIHMAQTAVSPPAMWETCIESLGQEDPLEKGLATHSSVLAWRIPCTEEPGLLWSMGSESQTGLSNFHFHRVTVRSKCINLNTVLRAVCGIKWWSTVNLLVSVWLRLFIILSRSCVSGVRRHSRYSVIVKESGSGCFCFNRLRCSLLGCRS